MRENSITERVILCVLLTFLLLLPASTAYQNNTVPEKAETTLGNLIPNPSFEEGNELPTGWDHKSVRVEGMYLWDSDFAKDGEKSVGMINVVSGCSDSAYWYTLEMIPVDPRNHTYTASVWYKFHGEKERCPSGYLRIVAYGKDKYYISTLDVPCTYEDNDWHYVEHDYDAKNDSSPTLPVDTYYVKISFCAWKLNSFP